MNHYRLPLVLFASGAVLLLAAGCLRGVNVKPAPPSPFVEVCASYYGTQVCADFAKAQEARAVASASATAAPRAVATVVPSAAPTGM